MKILHLISSGGMYGAEAVILSLSVAAAQLGHHAAIGVFVNSANPNLELHQAALSVGLDSHLLACDGQFDTSVPGRIRMLAQQTDADLIHAHGYKADVYAYLSRRGAPPLVATCHTWYDNDLAVRVYGAVDRWVLRSFAAVVAVSNEVVDRLEQSGVKQGRIHEIRNGIRVEDFAVPPRPALDGRNAGLRVGLVGRLAPEKGVDLLIDAAALVLKQLPLTSFQVVGEGPDRPALEARIAASGIGKHFELVGHRGEMPEFFRSLDLLVSTSRQEGLPIALLEGMASGLPLIAPAVGAIAQLMPADPAQSTGFLIDPTQPALVAETLIKLLCDPVLRQRLGASAQALIWDQFSARRMTQDYLALYRQVLNHND